jgi:hypothetical protein
MIRRFLCLAAVLVVFVLSVPGCGGSKPTENPIVPDPDGDYVPKPGAKAG